jgi:hypothetical protein
MALLFKMKLRLTLTLLALFSLKAFSQNTFPETGNVGIGTSTPTSNLQITGSNSSSSVPIGVNLTNTAATGKAQYSASNNNGKSIDFGIFGSTVGNGLGNSGSIGGNVPLVLLTDGNIATGGTSPVSFRVGGYNSTQERVRITADGNVGIGTTAPASYVHVEGTSPTKVAFRGDNYLNGNAAPTIQLRKSRGTSVSPTSVAVGDFTSAVEGWGYNGTNFFRSSYIVSRVAGLPTVNGIPTDMIFATNGGSADAQERMRIDNAGNVGIGTLTPTEKLTVAGNVSAREIKVIATAGADFVFDEDYNLSSLKNLETFIVANKHLPEIASAKEMVNNGLNLGEFNIKLLQKIEELTLHLIRQQKEIDDLKKRDKK